MMYYTLLNDEDALKPHCNCPKCFEDTLELLSIDHKNGRKKKDNLSGDKLYQYLKENDYPSSFQVLCFNCNFGKGADKICPHLWSENNE